MRPDTALYQLRSMTEAFLQNNAVYIAGSNISGVRNFYFGNNSIQPAGPAGPNEAFRFSTAPVNMENSILVQVHNVRMIPNNVHIELNDLEAYSVAAGPDILVTGQLSGCSFVTLTLGGQLITAHVQPGGTRAAGPMLKQSLEIKGRFHGHPNQQFTRVFGAGDYPNYAHVVGVRVAGQWKVYGQCFSGLGLNYRISGLTRIV